MSFKEKKYAVTQVLLHQTENILQAVGDFHRKDVGTPNKYLVALLSSQGLVDDIVEAIDRVDAKCRHDPRHEIRNFSLED